MASLRIEKYLSNQRFIISETFQQSGLTHTSWSWSAWPLWSWIIEMQYTGLHQSSSLSMETETQCYWTFIPDHRPLGHRIARQPFPNKNFFSLRLRMCILQRWIRNYLPLMAENLRTRPLSSLHTCRYFHSIQQWITWPHWSDISSWQVLRPWHRISHAMTMLCCQRLNLDYF